MTIAYIDLETDSNNQKIRDIGAICGEKELHTHQISELISSIQAADFICGHNFLHHDFPHLRAELAQIHKIETEQSHYKIPKKFIKIVLTPLKQKV